MKLTESQMKEAGRRLGLIARRMGGLDRDNETRLEEIVLGIDQPPVVELPTVYECPNGCIWTDRLHSMENREPSRPSRLYFGEFRTKAGQQFKGYRCGECQMAWRPGELLLPKGKK